MMRLAGKIIRSISSIGIVPNSTWSPRTIAPANPTLFLMGLCPLPYLTQTIVIWFRYTLPVSALPDVIQILFPAPTKPVNYLRAQISRWEPATMTHAGMDPVYLEKVGIMNMQIGIEDVSDLVDDLEKTLSLLAV